MNSKNGTTINGTTNSGNANINDFYIELKRSFDVDDIKSKIARIVNRLGFTDYTFITLTRDWKHELKWGFLSSWPDEYWRVYQQEKLYTNDILASFFNQNAYPSYTSYIYNYYADAPFDNEVTEKNRAIRQLQHSFGFFEAYAVPVHSNNKTYLLILSQQNMEAASFQARTSGMVATLRTLGQAIYAICAAKFPDLLAQPKTNVVDIAPKPLRVLATLANNDLTINDVAKKLCISPITAHQHIAAARKALNKQTNIGAIKEAIKLGIINYDDG